MNCPHCHATTTVKNGVRPLTGRQQYRCQNCQRQFVANPGKPRVSLWQKNMIGRLLLERIPLAGIARVVGVSERWLQTYANRIYARVPRRVTAKPRPETGLRLEYPLGHKCDELWSFVGNKNNKQWVYPKGHKWLALDRKTRAIVGDRSRAGAQALWASLPEAYRESAVCYTDYWEAYAKVFPEDRHVAAGKDSGLTNHIERFNNTLRQRVSRLVRQSLAFSKKLENHIGAIWLFVHHYNSSRGLTFVQS